MACPCPGFGGGHTSALTRDPALPSPLEPSCALRENFSRTPVGIFSQVRSVVQRLTWGRRAVMSPGHDYPALASGLGNRGKPPACF